MFQSLNGLKIPDLPLDDDPENFRPIKDLFRRITMSRGTGKLGKVVVQQDWQGRYFVTSVFGEENAKKVYGKKLQYLLDQIY